MKRRNMRRRLAPFFAPAIAVLIAVYAQSGPGDAWAFQRLDAARDGRIAISVTDLFTVAVLPFENLTGDPGRDVAIDGLVEEIIAVLSKDPRLSVLGGNSAASYKGRAVRVSLVAEELGVRYVLYGSVELVNGTARVIAKFTDTAQGQNVWAETFDRNPRDVFMTPHGVALLLANEIIREVFDDGPIW